MMAMTMEYRDVAGFLNSIEDDAINKEHINAVSAFLEKNKRQLLELQLGSNESTKYNDNNDTKRVIARKILGYDYDFEGSNEYNLNEFLEKELLERNSMVDIMVDLNTRRHICDRYIPDLNVNNAKNEDSLTGRISTVIDVLLNTLTATNSVDECVLQCMDHLEELHLDNEDTIQDIIDLIINYNILYCFKLLKLLTLYIINRNVAVSLTQKWFSNFSEIVNQVTLISSTHSNRRFLDNTERSMVDTLFIAKLESTISIVSIVFLGLSSAREDSNLNMDTDFLHDVATFKLIHSVLLDEMHKKRMPIVLYMWSFILCAKSIIAEDDSDEITSINELDFIRKCFPQDSIHSMSILFAKNAEDIGLLAKFLETSNCIRNDNIFTTLFASFMTLSVNFIPFTASTTKIIKSVLNDLPRGVIENFISNNAFITKFDTIKAKLPLIDEGLLPFINLTSINEELAEFNWEAFGSYAVKMPLGSIDYDVADRSNSNDSSTLEQIQLSSEVLVKPPFEQDDDVLMPLPKSTKAFIVADVPAITSGKEHTKDSIVKYNSEDGSSNFTTNNVTNETLLVFDYQYNGWSLLGRILQNLSILYTVKGNDINYEQKEFMIAAISLLSNIMSSTIPVDHSIKILESLSSQLSKPRDDDLISVVFKIFERALHKRNYELLCICASFTNVLVRRFPHFVWAYLSTSDLLDHYGKSGLVNIILGSIELTNGEYDFTISIAKMTVGLIDDAVTTSLYSDSGVPLKTKKSILSNLIVHLLNVYESFQFWKYSKSIEQRFELSLELTKAFSKILYFVHGIDSETPPESKITNVLSKAADTITNAFLVPDSYDPPVVISLINTITSPKNKTIYIFGNGLFDELYDHVVQKAYDLANLLVSIRGVSKLNASSLERMLFCQSPKLIDIYLTKSTLKISIVKLLNSLVGVPWSSEYPFLYSYLGHTYSEKFLSSIIKDLTTTLQDYQLAKTLYVFFGTLIRSKQDGLSILFLTGRAPDKAISSSLKNTSKDNQISILNVLKNNAKKMDQYPETTCCYLLEAISYAFNTWSNARNLDEDNDFIVSLLNKLENLMDATVGTNSSDDSQVTHDKELKRRYKLIARIVEIFALYIFTSKNPNSDLMSLLESDKIVPHLQKFFLIEGYQSDLQTNLEKNISEIWNKAELSMFALSPIAKTFINFDDNIFDISILDQCLGNDSSWTGTDSIRNQIIDASSNLQSTVAQVAAAKSWGALITAFIKRKNSIVPECYMSLLSDLLQYNIEYCVEAPIFTDVYMERLELVFFFLYNIHNNGQQLPDKNIQKLLAQLLEILKSPEVNFLTNIPENTGSLLYRPILRSILLLLSMVKDGPQFVELNADLLIQTNEESFCKGLYLLFSNILSEINSMKATSGQYSIANIDEKIQDISLLLNIVVKTQELNPSSEFNSIFASSLYEVGTLQVMLNLYSSSHLYLVNDEPILGQLSLSIIAELCMIREVAEKLITNGLFTVLVESPLSVALQRNAIKTSSQPRIHYIWSNGLLSITLILLSNFGSKILPETYLFISYFSNQIGNVLSSWFDSNMSVSTALVNETKQIILLQKMLEAINKVNSVSTSRNNSTVQNPDNVKQIPGLVSEQDYKQLNSALKKLLTHPKYLNSRIVASTTDEQHMLEEISRRNELSTIISNQIKEIQDLLFETL